MKTMPIIAQLRSTSGYDTDAPYVYLELDEELLARIEKAVSLYSRHQNDPSLRLSKLTIHGPSMTALVAVAPYLLAVLLIMGAIAFFCK